MEAYREAAVGGTTIFLGDSITEGWGVARGEGWVERLPGRNINRGISGDTTAGMLRRFSAHVLREKPARVVIMGGVNDLTERVPLADVIRNLQTMYDRADMRGIAVVPAICAAPDYPMLLENDWAPYYPGIQTLPENLARLADWIRAYAAERNWLCLDFAQKFPNYTTDGYTRYFLDGMHPNDRGHEILARIAQPLLYPETV